MKFRGVGILAAAVVLFVSASPVMAVIEFNDGLTHDIDYTINETVRVDYGEPAMQTTVSLLYGGNLRYTKIYGNSQFNMLGGSTHTWFHTYDESRLSIYEGSMYHFKAFNTSQVNIFGGTLRGFTTYDNSEVNMSNGVIGMVPFDIFTMGHSHLSISGGSIQTERILSYGYSQVDITGGLIESDLQTTDYSQINISGGSISSDLMPYDKTRIQIFGSDFAVDGTPVGYTELYSIFGGSYRDEPYRQLTGTLLSGDPINSGFYIGHDAKIVLIPEPASAVMLGLGGFFLLRKRRHR